MNRWIHERKIGFVKNKTKAFAHGEEMKKWGASSPHVGITANPRGAGFALFKRDAQKCGSKGRGKEKGQLMQRERVVGDGVHTWQQFQATS